MNIQKRKQQISDDIRRLEGDAGGAGVDEELRLSQLHFLRNVLQGLTVLGEQVDKFERVLSEHYKDGEERERKSAVETIDALFPIDSGHFDSWVAGEKLLLEAIKESCWRKTLPVSILRSYAEKCSKLEEEEDARLSRKLSRGFAPELGWMNQARKEGSK